MLVDVSMPLLDDVVVPFFLVHGTKVLIIACLKLGMYRKYNIGLHAELMDPARTLVFWKQMGIIGNMLKKVFCRCLKQVL